jgi:HD-GYP domain-containing protein (c-di-GMP phosphodiesterase class II)
MSLARARTAASPGWASRFPRPQPVERPLVVVRPGDPSATAVARLLTAHGVRMSTARTPEQLERLCRTPGPILPLSSLESAPGGDAPATTDSADGSSSGLRSVSLEMTEALVNAMEAKDVFLRGHSQRVAEFASAIAREMGLDAETVESVCVAGRVHDVGKIGIREAVLLKPGPLTVEEYAHIQTHVAIGVEILSPLRSLGAVLDYVHHHHERFDGSGYPQGLRGEEISIGGRVLAAADVFDALTSRRPYREPLSAGEAIGVAADLVGGLLDPAVYEALRGVIRRRSGT